MSGMDEKRLAEIRERVDELPDGPWELGWDGQQFYLRDGEGSEIMELTFAIPTWGERYEQAKAACDISVPEFLFHARTDIPDLLEDNRRLAALVEAQREERDAYKMRSEGQDLLLRAYRLGGRPPERAFKLLEKAVRILAPTAGDGAADAGEGRAG